jgi:NADH-quinone oxidoreductase subunit E
MQTLRERIEERVHRYKRERRFVLPAMLDMQREFKYVPREGLEVLADYVSCHMSELYAVATFYKSLSLVPRGKHMIKLCDGTACHIRGAIDLLDHVTRELNIKCGETTMDGLFSLETVNCLGACAISPVVAIDEKFYGKMTMEQLSVILESYKPKVTEL